MKLSWTVFLGVLAIAHPALADDAAQRYRRAYEAAYSNPDDAAAGAAFLALLPQVRNPIGPKQLRYLLEGDVRLTKGELKDYFLRKKAAEKAAREQAERKAKYDADVAAGRKPNPFQPATVRLRADGLKDIWPLDKRTLRYSVLKSTFPTDDTYRDVVENIRAAASDWEELCQYCGLQFQYRPELDQIGVNDFQNLTANDELRFIVVYNPGHGSIMAVAFYPQASWEQRAISIMPAFFGAGVDGRGVLRHELGHVLGYRHEHTRVVAGCVFEDMGWAPVTAYDPKSVMHYWCGNGGTRELSFSDQDRSGHQILYHPKATN